MTLVWLLVIKEVINRDIGFDCQLTWDNKVMPLAKLVNAKVHRVIWVASK